MSDTSINDYYPQEEAPPVSLTAGEAPETSPTPPLQEEAPIQPAAEEAIEDLGIDLPDIPLPDDEPIEDAVKDLKKAFIKKKFKNSLSDQMYFNIKSMQNIKLR